MRRSPAPQVSVPRPGRRARWAAAVPSLLSGTALTVPGTAAAAPRAWAPEPAPTATPWTGRVPVDDPLPSTHVEARAGARRQRPSLLRVAEPPGQCPRHREHRAYKEGGSGDLFRADATFCPGRGANGGVRLSACNFPEQYLRHRNAELWLAAPGGTHTWDNPAPFTEDTTRAVKAPWAP